MQLKHTHEYLPMNIEREQKRFVKILKFFSFNCGSQCGQHLERRWWSFCVFLWNYNISPSSCPAAASMAMVVHFRIGWVGKFVEVLFQCIASCSLPESTQLPAHSQFFNSRFKVLGPWWPPFYLHQGHRFLFVISNSFSLASAPSSLAPVQLQSPQPQSQFWSRYQRKQLWSPCDSQFVYDRRWPKQILFSSNTIGKAPVWFVLSDHQKKREKWKASDLIVWPHHPPRKRRDPARGVADKTRFITQSLCNKLEN